MYLPSPIFLNIEKLPPQYTLETALKIKRDLKNNDKILLLSPSPFPVSHQKWHSVRNYVKTTAGMPAPLVLKKGEDHQPQPHSEVSTTLA